MRRNKANLMKNREKIVFCTHGIQHGIRHGGSHDVAEVSYDPTVKKTKSPHFVKVVFTIGGMAVAIPYKNEAVKMVEALLPLFLSHESNSCDLVTKAL